MAKDQETPRNAGRSKENAHPVNFSLAGPDGRVYMTVLRREDLKRNAASKTKFWERGGWVIAKGLAVRLILFLLLFDIDGYLKGYAGGLVVFFD